MSRLMVKAGRMKDKKRKVSSDAAKFVGGMVLDRICGRFQTSLQMLSLFFSYFCPHTGNVTVVELPVSMGIAADGIVVVPNTPVCCLNLK